MSWKLGKSKSKQLPGASSLPIQDMDTSRSATPTPRNPDGSRPQFRSGILAIHVNRAEGLHLPPGVQIPPAVQDALASAQAQAALSVSPSSVTQQRLAKQRGHRDSVQRVGCWWLPYLVMEFEVNQIVLTPLGGDIKQPVYMYQATLFVPLQPSYIIATQH
jgi:serum/glucocorticoid-regulated kinase 2